MLKEISIKPFLLSLKKRLPLVFLYFIIVQIEYSFAAYKPLVSPFMPSSGLALAILFINGSNFWPVITAGSFLAYYVQGITPLDCLFDATGSTLSVLVGLSLLTYFRNHKKHFGLHSQTLGIISSAFGGAITFVALLKITPLILGNSLHELHFFHWITNFSSYLLGIIIFFPYFLSFRNKTKDKSKKYGALHLFAISFSGLFLLWLIFINHDGSIYLFFLFPYLFWVAAVFGERGLTLTTVLITLFGIFSVKFGLGFFRHGQISSNMINLELFTLSFGVCSLLMSDLKKNSTLWQPGLILFISWLMAGLFFFSIYIKTLKDSEKHFKSIISAVEPMIQDRLNLYFSALQNGSGLFAASETVERNEWRAFLLQSDIQQNLPGIDGLGVIFKVPHKNLNSFLAQTRKDAAPQFSYHSLSRSNSNSDHYIVTFFEPRESNQQKIGIDISSDAICKKGAEIARDLGTPTISEKMNLKEEPKRDSAFLLYYPLYSKGLNPKTILERRQRLIGWIYTPLHANQFFNSIFAEPTFKEILFRVSDHNNNLIATSAGYDNMSYSQVEHRSLKVGNQIFNFSFRRSAQFYSSLDTFSSWAGAISAVISLVIGAFIISLQNVKQNALDLAEKKTSDLRSSEELLKYALEGSGDCAWDWDISSGHYRFTEGITDLLGYKKKEFSGGYSKWKEFLHPEDQELLTTSIEEYFNSNRPFNCEHRVRAKNGEYKWMLARGMVVTRDQFNNPTRMVGTLTDISRFKEAEHIIERQRARLQAIYDSSSDALILFYKEENIDCNSRALKLFGYDSKEEFLNLKPSDFSPSLQPDGTNSLIKTKFYLNQTLLKGTTQFEWMHRKKNGDIFPAEVTLNAFDYDGKKCIQACIRDITERKIAENTLISEREKLVASAKMSSLGEMAGGIAHEINNPLAIISGRTTQLKRILETKSDLQFKKEIENLSVIETTTKRIAAIIKGLSAFSRNAENDKMERLEVRNLILDTVELSKERFRYNSVELRLNLDFPEKIFVMGRTSQLLQVLINLLNNAYDAIEFLEERWVEIKVVTENNKCIISITDSGKGIPLAVVEKMMTPFFTTKSVGKGTGLGLSISKGIIEDHRGNFYYDSKNPNTRFVIELPLALPESHS